MTIPALTVDWHDHYTPELRDRILAKLQTPADDNTFQLLTPGRLRALAKIDAGNWPVVSLYLQLSPDRRVGGAWRTHFASLANRVLKPIIEHSRRELLQDEFNRIENVLDNELPALGRGAAFFTCRQSRLWRQIAVSVPLPDSVHVLPKPYLRPLVRTRDEHDRFVLGVLSEELNRFFISQIMQQQVGSRKASQLVLPVSRYDIADYLALSVETVSRSLTALKDRGAIALAGPREIGIIDPDALTEEREVGEASPLSSCRRVRVRR